MKKVFFLFAVVTLLLSGCYKDDIDDLKSKYDSMNTMLTALQKQLTVTSVTPVSDGYRITFSDGSTADLKQGRDGTDAPSIVDIVIRDGNVEFKFSNGETITLPLTADFGFSIAGAAVQYFKYGESRDFTVTQSGVQNISISKPDGWKASITGNKLTVTAPVVANTFAEQSGTVSVVVIGNSQASTIASLEVHARDYNYLIDFEAASVLPFVATANGSAGVVDGGYVDAGSGIKLPASASYNADWDFWSWSGIAISQFNDVTTAGFANQLSASYKDAVTGFSGYGGSNTYAVVFGGQVTFDDDETECTFDHFWVTNSAYAALSMMNGDQFAKKFGTGDWFKLTVSAFDKDNNPTGIDVEFYLADFRTATSPGVITEWTMVDLTPLGDKVNTVQFSLESSDVGDWGMNTPEYFCFDNLAIKK